MTCTCNQTRELDEYQSHEGDFVEDFETMLDEMDQEGEGEGETAPAPAGVRRIGDLVYETDGEGEYDNEAELIGADSRVLVPDTTKAPFRYVVNIEYDFPGFGYRAMCSGTLIGPRTVLTAGHCLDGVTAATAKRLRILPGRAGRRTPFRSSRATGFVRFPGYAAATRTDLAVIHLASPLGTNPDLGFWTRSYRKNKGDDIGTSILPGSLPVSAGKLKVNLSGYPSDMPGDPKLGCRDLSKPAHLCRGSRLSRSRSPLCGTYQHRTYDLTVKLSGGLLYYVNDTCPGHSGSPVWVRRHPTMGGRVLSGVHIGGSSKVNAAVFIDSGVRAFIARNIR